MHPNISLRILLLTFLSFFFLSAKAQTYAGAGFGTFNIPAASNKFRGWGPTIKLEHVFDNEIVTTYFDLSHFVKNTQGSSVSVYDNAGNNIGSADAQTTHSYLYAQTGLKAVFFGEVSEKKILPYLGGGIALVYANATTSYKSSAASLDDDKMKRFIFGFHLSAGLQYYLQPLVLELRGNLDIDLKPLVPDSNVSNILSNTRLTVLLPLSKSK